MHVDISEYPKSLSWEMKAFSMPNIPRGDLGMVDVLKTILELVGKNASPSQPLTIKGSSSKIDLGTACIRLRPMHLVIKTQNGWTLSNESQKWLESGDNLYLAAFLCSRIKFVAEILYYLDSPKTAAQLQEIATNEYALSWKTKSDINSRLVWLRQLGLVEFQDFSLLYLITDLGKEFIKTVDVESPIKLDFSFDETSEDEALDISDWAIDKCNNSSTNRKPTIGYILGDVKQFQSTISEFIQLLDGGKTYEQILQYVTSTYDIAASSLRSFLTTLTGMNLVQRKTNIIYDITNDAKLLNEKGYTLDILCLIHQRFYFVFEILDVLKNTSMSYKELAATAKVSYGFERENVEEIRKRISMFKAAKLVKNSSIDKFTITNRAKKLLQIINVQSPIVTNTPTNEIIKETSITESTDAKFFTDLRLATKDSSNYDRLEQLVKIAFEKLGFEAQWLGGSGKTDVLIRAAGTASTSFSVTIDAKTTITGNVTDGLVDFDTLLEHKRKHNSDFSAIVGGTFQTERLISRAIEHGVVLIDVDTLERLIKMHTEVPIKVTSYKKVFETPGLADISCLDKEREEIRRYGNLIHAVMDCLINEQDDPVTQGILQDRDIYRSLRTNSNFSSIPSLDEISNMLQFLSSPLIGCVERSKDGFYAVGTLNDAAQKFEFFSKMCNTII